MKPVCVVAGVGPGNGAAFARRFASGGYAVALLARTTELTGKLASSLPDACAYPCDVTDAGSIARAFDATRRDLGDVEVLVYNASKSTAVASSMLPQTPEPRVMRRGAS
ncbi:MAG TPA: SDR family NAD(P)-dependent oxidoreductase [Burkholderiales bacterium]|nr:SDR family NAD(P)-dependent oxidoreductase [Burkholderiales bacterium]